MRDHFREVDAYESLEENFLQATAMSQYVYT